MKKEILHYLKHDRSYAAGSALVFKYSTKRGLKNQLNLQHESKYLLGIIHEELRHLAGLTMKEFQLIMFQPVIIQPVVVEPAKNVETPSGDDDAAIEGSDQQPANELPADNSGSESTEAGNDLDAASNSDSEVNDPPADLPQVTDKGAAEKKGSRKK